jgi:L-2-hydroxyglutarate oxidase
MEHLDIVIIGGGIVGMATAMALLEERPRRLVVVEAADRVAAHQSGHNSGVIHAGLYYRPGSLRATLCTEGAAALYRFCRERGVAHERCGKVVVAVDEGQVEALEGLARRGAENGLEGLRALSAAELGEHEPHVAGVAGLFVPMSGIVDFAVVTAAYADVVRERGGEIRLGAPVTAAARDGNATVITAGERELLTPLVINCAGLQSDRVARCCGVDPGVRIVPFRGEYFELAPRAAALVRNLVYPVPDPRFPFLGVHFTRLVGGGVEAGPNAVLSLARHGYRRWSFSARDALDVIGYRGFRRMARRHWRAGLTELHRSWFRGAFLRDARRLLPDLGRDELRPGRAGVRAMAIDADGAMLDDFRIVRAPGMIHVLNAPSPAATASIAIGRHIAALAAAPEDDPEIRSPSEPLAAT